MVGAEKMGADFTWLLVRSKGRWLLMRLVGTGRNPKAS